MKILKALSAGAVKRGVSRIAAEFDRATGTKVTVEFMPVPEIRQVIKMGKLTDVLIATPQVLDELAEQGKIIINSRGYIGRSRMGIVIHTGMPLPVISDTTSFRQALLGAIAVVYNEASSGLYAAKLMERLALVQELGTRIVVVKGGAAIMEYVAANPGAIGLAQISEIMVLIDQGCAVKLAAPLPDSIQNLTSYDAVVTTASLEPDAARGLVRALTSLEAKKIFAVTGID
jgi:molybdate transport system substrate-binding protein